MASPDDVVMGDTGESRPQEPLTVEENIQQLNAIDNSVVQLMNHTATALNALTAPSSAPGSDPTAEAAKPSLNPPSQKAAFQSATDSFLTTLHSIDVKMKRQIFGLEEAGIINLANPQRQEPNGPPKASLKPNGMGAVGNLDAGWLNSRGTRVERDMEAEIWSKAKDLLHKEGEQNK
ncbi:Mediator complex subunit Med11 [Fusarium albosuccineum]|uniref:Mediator of RNA polymerase II transcription subunit 11 n=1 Tax=Fusarium albosuccineum TaxID=1237068 RepID=A0A8H4LD86_9HYPO|nr:Mediator complex subunit Med11 [Fusarium albosuccineum]